MRVDERKGVGGASLPCTLECINQGGKEKIKNRQKSLIVSLFFWLETVTGTALHSKLI